MNVQRCGAAIPILLHKYRNGRDHAKKAPNNTLANASHSKLKAKRLVFLALAVFY